MNTTATKENQMAVTKAQLTERKRGKGGSIVLYHGERMVVKDLFARKGYNIPERVGVGPEDRGWAIGADLTELELA